MGLVFCDGSHQRDARSERDQLQLALARLLGSAQLSPIDARAHPRHLSTRHHRTPASTAPSASTHSLPDLACDRLCTPAHTGSLRCRFFFSPPSLPSVSPCRASPSCAWAMWVDRRACSTMRTRSRSRTSLMTAAAAKSQTPKPTSRGRSSCSDTKVRATAGNGERRGRRRE